MVIVSITATLFTNRLNVWLLSSSSKDANVSVSVFQYTDSDSSVAIYPLILAHAYSFFAENDPHLMNGVDSIAYGLWDPIFIR